MKPTFHILRHLRMMAACAAAVGFVVTVFLAYRWAEPSPSAFSLNSAVARGGVTLKLEKTPFAGYANRSKTWSIWAGLVEMERPTSSGLSEIQSADLTDIHDGILYAPPLKPPNSNSSLTMIAGSAHSLSSEAERPTARFHAKKGRYSQGSLDRPPSEIDIAFSVQWQFRLTGDVTFDTVSGDRLHAESLVIYNLTNRRSGKTEQRIVCDKGGQINHKGVQLNANLTNYNPADRSVECLGGVRGKFNDGYVQAERVFWSLKEERLSCPEIASGVIQNIPFSAEGLTWDVKKRTLNYRTIHADVPMSGNVVPHLP